MDKQISPLELAVIKTLVYADLFEYPLSLEEIYQYLISPSVVSKSRVEKCVNKLTDQAILESNQSSGGEKSKGTTLYALAGKDKHFVKRSARKKMSYNKTQIALTISFQISKIPWIEAIYLTGSVSMDNAKRHDDIDLMIITAPGRVWLTRLLVNTMLDFQAKRRKPEHTLHAKSHSNKFCLNLWLSLDRLKLNPKHQNLYTAHEVIQAKPIYLKSFQVHDLFLGSNTWVKFFLPHTPLPKLSFWTKRSSSLPFFTNFLDVIEAYSYKIQQLYMYSRKTSERTSPSQAFFHPRNTSELIISQYETRLARLLHNLK